MRLLKTAWKLHRACKSLPAPPPPGISGFRIRAGSRWIFVDIMGIMGIMDLTDIMDIASITDVGLGSIKLF